MFGRDAAGALKVVGATSYGEGCARPASPASTPASATRAARVDPLAGAGRRGLSFGPILGPMQHNRTGRRRPPRAAGGAEPRAEGPAADRRRLLGAARRAGDRAAPAGRPPTARPACAASAGTSATRRPTCPRPPRWRRPGTRRGSSGSARLLAGRGRRKGVDVLLAPTVNLHRTPYGGRHFECFSEDPLLTARIGAAYVRGAAGRRASARRSSTSSPTTPRPSASRSTPGSTSARCASSTWRRSRRSSREARPWAVMAAYNGVNGTTMTESPLLRDVLQGRVGLRRRRHVRLVRAPGRPRRAGNAGLDLRHARAGRARGATRWSTRCATGACARRRSTTRSLRLLRAGGAGRRAGRRRRGRAVRPPVVATADVAAELRAAAAAGFVLARNEGDAAPARRRGPAPRRRARPERRRRRGRWAAAAPRSSRPTPSRPLDGLRAALGPASTVSTRPGVRAHDRIAAGRPPELARRRPGVEVRFLAADGARAAAPSSAAPAPSPGSGSYGDGVPDDRRRGGRGPRAPARRGGRRARGRRSGVGRFALTLDGERRVRRRARAAAGRRPGRGASCARPSTACRSRSTRARRWSSSCATSRVGGPDTSFAVAGTAFQLNVEPPHGSDDEELERAVAARAPTADVAVVVVGTTEEVESEGFDRDSLALPGPPGRARPARRRGQPAHRRGGQRGRAGAAAVGRRGRRRCC